jgi:hypothetical protein
MSYVVDLVAVMGDRHGKVGADCVNPSGNVSYCSNNNLRFGPEAAHNPEVAGLIIA